MKKLFLCLVILTSFSCKAQNQESKATKDASGNLIGIVIKNDFLQEPFNFWFNFNYEDYTVNQTVIEKLKPLLKDIKIKAFMGTWCGDSQEQTPVFYKVLDNAGFNYTNLQLIAVDRSKTTPDNLQEGFDIIRVPTFIFYKENEEIGRFVEYPRESVEEDILKIVSGEPYKHSYED
jgi:thiol-disulfide isomerase/thioredoxin